MISIYVNGKDVSEVIVNPVWSGDDNEAARRMTFCMPMELSSIADTGDGVNVYFDNEEIFTGLILFRELDIRKKQIKLSALDYGVYLIKNKAFKTYKGTPQAIAKAVCAEAGIGVGKLVSSSDSKKVVCIGDKTYLQALREAYGYGPRIFISGAKLNVKAPEVAANIGADILEETVSIKSAEDMVNRVVAVRSKRVRGEVEDSYSRMRYGTFTDRYTVIRGHTYAPESKLKGLKDIVKLRGIGDMDCVAGEYVELDSSTGMAGKYIIKEDVHIFLSPQAHIMELQLEKL